MRLIRFLFRFIVGVLALVGLLIVLLVAGIATLGWRYAAAPAPSVPAVAVLEVDLRDGVVERRREGLLLRTSLGPELVLRDLTTVLEAAARDPRIKGLTARFGSGGMNYAQAQEIRDAVIAFRRQGKFAVAFADTYDGGNIDYLLATAFDEIWLQPSGEVGLAGILIEAPFLREALDNIGVTPQLDQRREYKGGADTFAAKGMSQAQRRNLQQLADSLVAQIVRAVAVGRKLDEARARSLLDQGPWLAKEAMEAGLVDRLGYWDEVRLATSSRAGSGAGGIGVADYLAQVEPPPASAKRFALVYGLGPIRPGVGGDRLIGDEGIAGDRLATAIGDAVADPGIAAIILRIDSPGGSYVASDTVWREVERSRHAGKPLVVSMGGIVASGGYFIAAPASGIVAEPGSITGSIGVYAGKFVLDELWDRLGVSWEGVESGENAGMWSANRPYSNSQWAKLQAMLDRIYSDFTAKVAVGRNLPIGKVDEIAGGRIWSGADAAGVGLVDELGGLGTAVAMARRQAGIAEGEAIRLEEFPPVRSPVETLVEQVTGRSAAAPELTRTLRHLVLLADRLAPVLDRLALILDRAEDDRLAMPPMRASD